MTLVTPSFEEESPSSQTPPSEIDYQLVANVKHRLSKKAIANMSRYKTCVACPEPCSFRSCMNSCRHNLDTEHVEHLCKDHAVRAGTMEQQTRISEEQMDMGKTLYKLQRTHIYIIPNGGFSMEIPMQR